MCEPKNANIIYFLFYVCECMRSCGRGGVRRAVLLDGVGHIYSPSVSDGIALVDRHKPYTHISHEVALLPLLSINMSEIKLYVPH